MLIGRTNGHLEGTGRSNATTPRRPLLEAFDWSGFFNRSSKLRNAKRKLFL